MIGMSDRAVSETFLMDRLEEVFSICGEDILDRLGTGHISPAAYDTGFVARISDEEGDPEFPQTLDWLVANQRDDGSWGSDVHHTYDRFINTLSATIALKERDRSPAAVAMAVRGHRALKATPLSANSADMPSTQTLMAYLARV